MKMFKRLLTLVLTVALSLSCMGQVKAADVKEAYTYKVTLYAGNRGEFNTNVVTVDNANAKITESAGKIVIEDLEAGDKVSVSQNIAKVTDDKYYVKGIRLSGRDNDSENITTLIEVEKDVDYVVAYGIKGNQVAYTVNYVDVDGNVLAEADTFYGNVGDKPVVAYKYIEGYVPEVYGFTKTLSENADDNVFTFVYDEAPTPTIIIENVGGTGTGGQGGQDGQGGNAGQAGQDNAGQIGNDAQGNAGQDNQGDDGNDDTIVDLDDDQTPGGNIDVDGSNLGMIGGIAIAVSAAVALLVLILAMMKKRKENTQ